MSDQKNAESIIPMILDVHPLVLEVGSRLSRSIKDENLLSERVARLRSKLALSQGVVFPRLTLRENSSLAPEEFSIKIREVEVRKGGVRGGQACESLERQLGSVVSEYAHEFLGTAEVQELLDHLRSREPQVVQAVYPSQLSLADIQRVLQNLLREEVPIRDLVRILETLGEYAGYTRDPDILTEYVRHGLSRVLGSLYQNSFVVKAFVLDRKIEQWIMGAIRWDEGVYLDLDPRAAMRILRSLERRFRRYLGQERPKKGMPVLLVSPEIRRFMRSIVERLSRNIPVLAYTEISSEYRVRTLGVIRLERWFDYLRSSMSALVRGKQREKFPGDNLQKAILILNLLGPASNQVGQYLTPQERDALKARAMVAPVPVQGRDEIVEEFIALLPPDKNIKNLESLCQLALREPSVVALALQRDWLASYSNMENGAYGYSSRDQAGRDETGPREKAAVFISSAARWVQDEVYRLLHAEDLRELGCGMLQFPFISHEGKRKAWEEYEGILYKDEWWDPETLARFIQSSMRGKIDDFKRRGFRPAQKLAILLLSLPSPVVMRIGREVLDSLPKSILQPVLGELGQWRDQLPSEARIAAIQEFLDFAAEDGNPDFQFSMSHLPAEVERIVHRDPKGAASVMRALWTQPRDPWSVFESLALSTPGRVASWLVSYAHGSHRSASPGGPKKAGYFLASLHPELAEHLKKDLSAEELGSLEIALPPRGVEIRTLMEFLRGYYGGGLSSPIPFLKGN